MALWPIWIHFIFRRAFEKSGSQKHFHESQWLPNSLQVYISEVIFTYVFLYFVNITAKSSFFCFGLWPTLILMPQLVGQIVYVTDRNADLTDSKVKGDLSLLCMIHLGLKLLRYLLQNEYSHNMSRLAWQQRGCTFILAYVTRRQHRNRAKGRREGGWNLFRFPSASLSY